jgi:hypothetical protein
VAEKISLWDGTLVRTFRVPIREFPDFEGTVRPMTPSEAAKFQQMVGSNASRSGWDEVAETAKVYAQHLKSWNVDAEITPANIAQLPLPVHNQLWGIVMGHAPGEEVKKS